MKLNKSILLIISMLIIIMLIGTQSISPVLATNSGSIFPNAGISVTAGPGTTAWINPGNITADDSVDAQVGLASNSISEYLEATDFGFALPSSAIIQGITVTIGRSSAGVGGGRIEDNTVKIIKNGTPVGTNYAALGVIWPPNHQEQPAIYSPVDPLWGTTWTATDINANNFGVAVSVINPDLVGTEIAFVDYISVSVSYIVPTTLIVTPISYYYGYYTDLSASLTPAVSGKTISFTLNGEAACSGLTNAAGIATCQAPLLSNVGNYPTGVAATFSGDADYVGSTGSANLLIQKRPASVTPDAKSKVYGDSDPILTGTLSNFIPPDNISASYSRTPGETVAGSPYTISATLVDPYSKLGNYEITNNTAAFTITKKPATVTANAKSKIYGDDNPALTATVVGQVTGDPINYSLSTTAVKLSNVGGYPIVVTLGANPNYDVTKTDGTLTINPKSATVTANANSKIYGDDNPAFTATVVGQVVGGATINYSLSTTAVKLSNVGSYPIVVTLGSNPNYSVTKTDGTLTINQKAATVTANANSKIYGDDNPAFTATVVGQVVGGDTINYSLSTTATKYSNVGSYPILVTLGSNPNYNVSKTDGTLAISPKAATVVANAKSKTYGDDNPALTATVSGQVAGGDAINYSLSTTATKYSNVGSYPIVVTLGSNPNYNVSKTDSTLNITQKTATVIADAKSKSYGDDNPALTATLVGQVVGGAPLNYSLSTTAVKLSSVGSYPIVVTLGSNPNYDVSKVDSTLTINQKVAVVLAVAKSKNYGDDNPALTATVVGQVVGGDPINYSLSTTAVKLSNAGSYPIVVALGSNPNYNVSKTDGTLTINPKAATVLANPKNKTYGDDNPALTATVVGQVVGGATINYSLSTSALKYSNVGNYPIVVTLGSNPNYDVSKTDDLLTITTRPVTVTADDMSKVVGHPDPIFTYEITSGMLVNGDTFTGALSRDPGELVGTYNIIQGSLAINSNYNLTVIGATFIITNAYIYIPIVIR
jgi:MBG domain (YGX type)